MLSFSSVIKFCGRCSKWIMLLCFKMASLRIQGDLTLLKSRRLAFGGELPMRASPCKSEARPSCPGREVSFIILLMVRDVISEYLSIMGVTPRP